MAYSPKGVMDIFDILPRWHAGYSIAGNAKAIGADRKTVRCYVREAASCGLSRVEPMFERGAVWKPPFRQGASSLLQAGPIGP